MGRGASVKIRPYGVNLGVSTWGAWEWACMLLTHRYSKPWHEYEPMGERSHAAEENSNPCLNSSVHYFCKLTYTDTWPCQNSLSAGLNDVCKQKQENALLCLIYEAVHGSELMYISQISTLTFSHRLMYTPLMDSMKTKCPILLPLKHNFTVLHWLSPQSTPECQSLCLAVASSTPGGPYFHGTAGHDLEIGFTRLWVILAPRAVCTMHSAQCTCGEMGSHRWVFHSSEAGKRQSFVFWWKCWLDVSEADLFWVQSQPDAWVF